MDKYTNRHHPEYIPGTFNIFSSDNLENGIIYGSKLKKSKEGIILIPQPSDSPNDPLNWSNFRKGMHFFLMAFITAFTAATSNDASATQDSLNAEYGISYDAMNTGAGVLFMAIGWSTLFMAPFSFLYGRRITYIICTTLGMFGALWFALAKDTSDTIWSQFFVGISESCSEAQVQLSLTDIFFQHQLGSVLTIYISAISIGTFLGPLVAGYIASLTSFRWVGWCGFIISACMLVWIIFGCEETYFDREKYVTPLSTRQVQNSEDGTTLRVSQNEKQADKVYSSDEEKQLEITKSRETLTDGLIDGSKEPLKPYWKRIALITPATNIKGWGFKQYFKYLWITFRMMWFPPVILSGLFWGFQDVFLSFYLTTEDTFFQSAPYNLSDYGVAIMTVPTLIGAVIGCIYAGTVSDYFVLWMARRNGGILEAEYRLWFTFAAMFIGPAGLLMFGIGAAKGIPWPTIYVGLGFIGFAWGCSGDIGMGYLMDCYPDMVLEGMVGTAIINNTSSSIFTFVCSLWLDAQGTQGTYIVLACLNFGIMLLAIPMLIWGKEVRLWTRKMYLESVNMRDGI